MKNFKDDFGLGIIAILIIIFDFLFFLGLLIYGHFDLLVMIPGLVAGLMLLTRHFFIKLPDLLKIFLLTGLAVFVSLYNYSYIADLDKIVNFKRLDFFFAQFDMLVFHMPVANFIGSTFPFNTSWAWFFNDLIMVNYILFYFLGLYAIFAFYFSLDKKHKYKAGICGYANR